MPLPFILGGIAVAAGATGVAAGVNGAAKMKGASDKMKAVERQHNENIERFERHNENTTAEMDRLGEAELYIVKSFKKFSDTIEKIQGRPEFNGYIKSDVNIPSYDPEELKKASVGAGVLLGGLGGAAAGTAGGFAAAGATTSAVMALGTASTGAAISGLSGVAATNATLAAIGGGSIAAGGGGMALGTTILGATTLGVGLLVGGVIFNITGSSLSNKADEAYSQMKIAETQINTICRYLDELCEVSIDYRKTLEKLDRKYNMYLNRLITIVDRERNWDFYSEQEQLIVENTVRIVAILFHMCKVNIVKSAKSENEMNTINRADIKEALAKADALLMEV